MAEYMITRASIINRCNSDGKLHNIFTDKERPCKEAYLKELRDKDGEICSRFFIQIDSIEAVDELGEKYDVDVLVTRNLDFEGIISLVLYDEEIDAARPLLNYPKVVPCDHRRYRELRILRSFGRAY